VRDALGKGKGVFASRPFAKPDVILAFEQGPIVDRDGLTHLGPWEREHLSEIGIGLWRVLPEPRCYLNHACDPNAVSTDVAVYALRPIALHEEITIDYRLNAYIDGAVWVMRCTCDRRRGRHDVLGDFFRFPRPRRSATWSGLRHSSARCTQIAARGNEGTPGLAIGGPSLDQPNAASSELRAMPTAAPARSRSCSRPACRREAGTERVPHRRSCCRSR